MNKPALQYKGSKSYLAFSTTAKRLNVNIVEDSTLSGLQGLMDFAFPPALPMVIYIKALRALGLKIRCVYPASFCLPAMQSETLHTLTAQ